MFTSHMPPQILLPREALSPSPKSRIRARRHPAKELSRRLMKIIDMPSDILLGLEAATAALTLAWMGVRFQVSASNRSAVIRVEACDFLLALMLLRKCSWTALERT